MIKDGIIDSYHDWFLYENGDVTWNPKAGKWSGRDYWITASRLKTPTDIGQWIKHMRTKLWWDDWHEDCFEMICKRSFELRNIPIDEAFISAHRNGWYLHY